MKKLRPEEVVSEALKASFVTSSGYNVANGLQGIASALEEIAVAIRDAARIRRPYASDDE